MAGAPVRVAATRAYPLEIEDVVDPGDDELRAVFSRGHHPAGAAYMADRFLDAARNHLDRVHCFDDDELAQLDPAGVRFEWWRCVPAPDIDPGEYRTVFHDARPGRRGAFPVTVVDVPTEADGS